MAGNFVRSDQSSNPENLILCKNVGGDVKNYNSTIELHLLRCTTAEHALYSNFKSCIYRGDRMGGRI